jgi:spore maturation protein CgeB
MWDEEYIAQAFEQLGHEVGRVTERDPNIIRQIEGFEPDVVLWAKLQTPKADQIINHCKEKGIKTVCWVWDLYWGYNRENKIHTDPMFRADLVFTSDGGHDKEWESVGIKHKCIRQGIREEECYREEGAKRYDVVFVGSYNQYNTERNEILDKINTDFKLNWFGKMNSDQVRGPKLNRLLGESKIVVGDSVYSPHYWSNRIVETLGRGGLLIHQEVEGLEEEYPFLITYKRGDYKDLKQKIGHYMQNPEAREKVIQQNLDWVKKHHTCKLMCKELCQNL